MESLFTLPAEAYIQTNGSPAKSCVPSHPLAGNIIWAVGHLPDSTNHTLHYFNGIKGGTFQWHTFRAPMDSAEEVQLELGQEGALGLRMDRELFLGTVQSVSDASITWTRTALACRDFQMGRDLLCHRKIESDTFVLTQIEQIGFSRELPPSPDPPDCYCLSARDDILVLSGLQLLVLSAPYAHWTRIITAAPPRNFLSIFAPQDPVPSKLCVTRGHLCSLSRDGLTLSLLLLAPSTSWRHVTLSASARQVCPISGTGISFLILDKHFLLSLGHLDTGTLRPLELPPSLLPDREVLSSVRAIRSIFDNSSDSLSPLVSPCSAPQESFFTAPPPDQLEMEFESSAPSAPSPPSASSPLPFESYQSADLFPVPVPTADSFAVPTADPFAVPTADSLPVPAGSWLLSETVFSQNHSEVRTGSKRPKHSELNSQHKLFKNEHLCESADPASVTDTSYHTVTYAPGRSSEERRTDRRFLRDRTSPCPLLPYSFTPLAHDLSHFEVLLEDSQGRGGVTPIDLVQGILFDQEFDFSLARDEKSNLSKLFPDSSPKPESPPPPSAPPTVPVPNFEL